MEKIQVVVISRVGYSSGFLAFIAGRVAETADIRSNRDEAIVDAMLAAGVIQVIDVNQVIQDRAVAAAEKYKGEQAAAKETENVGA